MGMSQRRRGARSRPSPFIPGKPRCAVISREEFEAAPIGSAGEEARSVPARAGVISPPQLERCAAKAATSAAKSRAIASFRSNQDSNPTRDPCTRRSSSPGNCAGPCTTGTRARDWPPRTPRGPRRWAPVVSWPRSSMYVIRTASATPRASRRSPPALTAPPESPGRESASPNRAQHNRDYVDGCRGRCRASDCPFTVMPVMAIR